MINNVRCYFKLSENVDCQPISLVVCLWNIKLKMAPFSWECAYSSPIYITICI